MSQQPILSSLPLQISIYFHGYFSVFWLSTTVATLFWKRYYYFFQSSAFAWELIFSILLYLIDVIRLELATRGNKLEQIRPLVYSGILCIPMFVGYCFFLELQTFILRVDEILNIIGLSFVSFEVVFGALTVHRIYRYMLFGSIL